MHPLAEVQPRVFAVVPAAGLARRMGRSKLDLPLGDKPVLNHVLDRLAQTSIITTIVVLGKTHAHLGSFVTPPAVALRLPVDTPDMRASVTAGLDYLAQAHQPNKYDAFLLVLADQPSLSVKVVSELIAAHTQEPAAIRVPFYDGKRGHPVLFPWLTVEQIRALTPEVGINALLRHAVANIVEHPTDEPSVLDDLDDPADYSRHLARKWTQGD